MRWKNLNRPFPPKRDCWNMSENAVWKMVPIADGVIGTGDFLPYRIHSGHSEYTENFPENPPPPPEPVYGWSQNSLTFWQKEIQKKHFMRFFLFK